jgi:hypothetical protein
VSYIVIRVYNFECDWPGCPVSNIEVSSATDLRDARRILRKTEHWTTDRDGRDLCPKHTGKG